MAEKRNIFLVGPMGSGKSTIGRHLSQLLKMDFFDSDHEMERRTGVNIDWILDIEGEAGFRSREEKIIAELTNKQGIVLATGKDCIQSKTIRTYLSARGMVIYLEITTSRQLKYAYRDQKHPPHSIPNYSKVTIEALADEPGFLYKEISDVIVRTNNQSPRLIVKQILQILETSR
ncbi:Shikimate kinase 1 [Candidatus Erwinia haradaeae]|uniref:Shikimate kinase 1 n=1 Tax=Candidatus Erwinia haradaeae TaxID=1922217 RepID=A0A451DLP5_9GAMM|nr:shikimate kinase AroK [Candidatus Erwinia haradaeae]VFP87648.1 Shikimate kinase 1 [Candidatus Erwinia haradaeae]